MSTFLGSVAEQLPAGIRPDRERLFEGLALVLADRSETVSTKLHNDLPGATMDLLLLFAGVAGLGGRDVPAAATLVAAAAFPTN